MCSSREKNHPLEFPILLVEWGGGGGGNGYFLDHPLQGQISGMLCGAPWLCVSSGRSDWRLRWLAGSVLVCCGLPGNWLKVGQ